MKKDFRKNNGAAFIVVILVIIIVSAGGFAAFLGIRMAVTGDSFLAPLEEWGWIEAKKDEDDEKNAVSEEVSASGVDHYRMDLGDIMYFNMGVSYYHSLMLHKQYPEYYSDDYLENVEKQYDTFREAFDGVDFSDTIVLDLYAKSDELVELDVKVDYDTFFQKYYEYVKDVLGEQLKEENIDNYAEFKEYLIEELLEDETDSIEEYFTADNVVEMLMETMELEDLGFTKKEIKKCLTVEADSEIIDIHFTFNDKLNEEIYNGLEENIGIDEFKESLKNKDIDVPKFIENFELSEDYVEDLINLINEAVDWAIENNSIYEEADEEFKERAFKIFKII